MSRNMNWKTGLILSLALAVVVTSGGLVMASNMGFKINRSLVGNFNLASAPKGDNWISLPYNNPYGGLKDLCNAMGLGAGATLTQINPANGFPTNQNCALAFPNTTIVDTRGVRLRLTPATPTNAILVGAHDTSTFDIVGGFVLTSAPKADNWISVPYHTTWAKAENVCAGLGLGAGQGQVIRVNAGTGGNSPHPCGNSFIQNFSLVVGEALLVRKTTAGNIVGHSPAHF